MLRSIAAGTTLLALCGMAMGQIRVVTHTGDFPLPNPNVENLESVGWKHFGQEGCSLSDKTLLPFKLSGFSIDAASTGNNACIRVVPQSHYSGSAGVTPSAYGPLILFPCAAVRFVFPTAIHGFAFRAAVWHGGGWGPYAGRVIGSSTTHVTYPAASSFWSGDWITRGVISDDEGFTEVWFGTENYGCGEFLDGFEWFTRLPKTHVLALGFYDSTIDARLNTDSIATALRPWAGDNVQVYNFNLQNANNKVGIQSAVSALSSRVAAGDNVVIYWSGHGTFQSSSTGFPAENPGFNKDLPEGPDNPRTLLSSGKEYLHISNTGSSQHIPDTELKSLFGTSKLQSTNLTLIIQACFSGGLIDTLNPIADRIITSSDAAHFSYNWPSYRISPSPAFSNGPPATDRLSSVTAAIALALSEQSRFKSIDWERVKHRSKQWCQSIFPADPVTNCRIEAPAMWGVPVTATRPEIHSSGSDPGWCVADCDGNRMVDDADFLIFVRGYEQLLCDAMPAACPADLDANLLVDDADFEIFAAAYNALICP